MSLGVKGGAVLYRRKQKTRKMEDYSKYMVNRLVTASDGNEGEEMLWWTDDSVVSGNGEKGHE